MDQNFLEASKFIGVDHNISQLLKPYDRPPKFDGTFVTHVAQTLRDD